MFFKNKGFTLLLMFSILLYDIISNNGGLVYMNFNWT